MRREWIIGLFVLGLLFFAGDALASGTATGLPWEGPLERFVASIRGPVAYSLSLLGLIVCGGMLVFGGELNEMVRRLVILVLVISILAFAVAILNTLFAGGASVVAGHLP